MAGILTPWERDNIEERIEALYVRTLGLATEPGAMNELLCIANELSNIKAMLYPETEEEAE